MEEPEEMTTAEAAEKLGMSDRHIRHLIRKGELSAREQKTRRGPILWVNKDDLQAFLIARQEKAERRATEQKKPMGRPPRVPELKEGDAE